MAIKSLEMEDWRRKMSRALIIGPPGAWKTSSLRTWPKPIGVIVAPGELGYTSLSPDPDVKMWYWENDAVSKESPASVAQEFETHVLAVLSGKFGKFETVAIDGVHKYYGVLYERDRRELANSEAGGKMDDETIASRAYGRAHNSYTKFIKMVSETPTPNIVMTAWSAMEKDDPEAKRSAKHAWPDLPGQMAQKIVGEFGAVLYAKPGIMIAPGKYGKGKWITRPFDVAAGVGIKVPAEMSALIPNEVDQDWGAFTKMIDEAYTKAFPGVKNA